MPLKMETSLKLKNNSKRLSKMLRNNKGILKEVWNSLKDKKKP